MARQRLLCPLPHAMRSLREGLREAGAKHADHDVAEIVAGRTPDPRYTMLVHVGNAAPNLPTLSGPIVDQLLGKLDEANRLIVVLGEFVQAVDRWVGTRSAPTHIGELSGLIQRLIQQFGMFEIEVDPDAPGAVQL